MYGLLVHNEAMTNMIPASSCILAATMFIEITKIRDFMTMTDFRDYTDLVNNRNSIKIVDTYIA